MKRPPKKNDTLEVRLPEETKQAFMERARAEGRSASEIIRDFIETYLARPLSKKELLMYARPTFEIAAAVALVIGIVTLTPTPSRADSQIKYMYDRYDENKDGEVTAAELAASMKQSLENPPKGAAPPALPQGFNRDAMYASIFSGMDLNKDGTLTLDEFRKYNRAIAVQGFNRIDDGDGKLTIAEIAKSYQANQIMHLDAAGAEAAAKRMLEKADANKDGVLSSDEYGPQ